MPNSYLASSIPPHQLAELHRLMNEEIEDVAVFFMDPKGIITVWNRGAEVMKGYTAQDAIGSHLALLYTDEDKARGWPQHNLKEAQKHGFYKEETWRKRKDGSLFWARIALTALRDRSGQLLGFSKITMDLTDHKQLERCVKEREQTLRVLRAANAVMWTWHPEKGEIDICENFLRLLGRPGTEKTLKLDEWLGFVHEDDRALVAERLRTARAEGRGEPLSIEMRLCSDDGSCRWYGLHADWHRDSEASPLELSGVNVDIEQLRTAAEELRQAVKKLRDEDARKDEFLAMLAHELRNPLAPIRAAADVLRIANPDQRRVQKTSEVIARQVEHMTRLVDDLLDVSRVTRGLVKLDKSRLDVRQIVAEAIEQVNPIVRARHHHLALQLSPLPTLVTGDKKRLIQVIANLLNNAAKFTQEGGNIVLKTEVHEGYVHLGVIDDGIGMEPDLAARVFELFAQAERTPDRSSGGLGLGLALVKSLVELQGGTVTCSSAGLGKGSRFAVCLPLVDAEGNRLDSEPEQRSLPAPERPLRVMVVDDNVDAAAMLALLLESSGHRVTVEHGAPQALAQTRIEVPDVYLLDIGLPEMDGNQLAQRLRAQPETAHAVLIAVTGYGQRHDRDAALASGFDHHLVKPVDAAELMALLANASMQKSGK